MHTPCGQSAGVLNEFNLVMKILEQWTEVFLMNLEATLRQMTMKQVMKQNMFPEIYWQTGCDPLITM